MRRFFFALMLSLGFSLGSEAFLVERIFLSPFVLEHAEILGLTLEQKEKIENFVAKTEPGIQERVKLVEFLSRRAKLLMIEGRDEKEIKEILTDIALLKLRLSLENAREIRFLKETLSKEQFEKLKDLLTVRLFEITR